MLTAPVLGRQRAERFWVAGRCDGNRIVVYFDKVKFAGTMSSKARKIAPPVADAFFDPAELPASCIAGFQKTISAEHLAIGDRYDLMLGNLSARANDGVGTQYAGIAPSRFGIVIWTLMA